MQQSCTCGSVRGASGQLASLPRPPNFVASCQLPRTRLNEAAGATGTLVTGSKESSLINALASRVRFLGEACSMFAVRYAIGYLPSIALLK